MITRKTKEFIYNFCDSLFHTVETIGAAATFETLYRSLAACHPLSKDPCNIFISRFSNTLAVILSYIDFSLQQIPQREHSALQTFKSIWRNSSSIMANNAFVLMMFLAIWVEVNGEEKEMDNKSEFLPAAIGALLTACLMNKEIRHSLSSYLSQLTGNRNLFRPINSFFTALEGFAAGRHFISLIEAISDKIHQTSEATYSSAGKAIRYSFAGAVAVLKGTSSFLHNEDQDELRRYTTFKRLDEHVSLFLKIIKTINFFILKGLLINEEEKNLKILFSLAFASLFFLAFVNAWFKRAELAEEELPIAGGRFANSPHSTFYRESYPTPAIGESQSSKNADTTSHTFG